MRLVWVAVLALALAGCSDGLIAEQARDSGFVGQPVGVLEQSMGPAGRAHDQAGVSYLTYEIRRVETVPNDPFCNGPGMWCGAIGFPPPKPPTLVCDTTFVVRGGVVRSYDMRGDACGGAG